MLLHLLIAIVSGILAGIITGLTPGIHLNLVALLAFSFSATLLQITSPIVIMAFIIAVAITHTFLDFIPSCFLGAPEESTVLSILPAHRLLLKGRGYEAVKLTVIGSLLGLIIIIVITPFLLLFVSSIYPKITTYMAYILIVSTIFLLLREKNKVWALITFLAAGILGIAVLSLKTLNQPLLPMLGGLFGISSLVLSINTKVKIPEQKITQIKVKPKDTAKAMSSGLFASVLTGLLPGVGPGQAAIIASSIFKKWSTEAFLILVGAINTMIMILSFIALYTIDKARNGAIVIISKMIETFTINHLILIIAISLIVGAIATVLAIKIGRIFANLITKINYKYLCILIIIIVTITTFIFSSFLGLLVLLISTFIGIIPASLGIGRNHLMGCLILPVILYFLL